MSAWDWAREDEAARRKARQASIDAARADGERTGRGDRESGQVAPLDLAREWGAQYVYGEPGGDEPAAPVPPILGGRIAAAWLEGYQAGAAS